jgi:hypothetical protein
MLRHVPGRNITNVLEEEISAYIFRVKHPSAVKVVAAGFPETLITL